MNLWEPTGYNPVLSTILTDYQLVMIITAKNTAKTL